MFNSGQLFIDGVDMTQVLSTPKALSFAQTRGQRGQSTLPLELVSTNSYQPTEGHKVEIYDPAVGQAGATRVFLGSVFSFEEDWISDEGHRVATIQTTSLEQLFDSLPCPELDFSTTPAQAGDILIAIYSAVSGLLPISVGLGTVDPGALINRTYNAQTNAWSAFQQLATDSNYIVYIDPRDGNLYFHAHSLRPAPWTLTDARCHYTGNGGDLKYKQSQANFRSQQIIALPPGIVPPLTASFPGDGSTTDWTLPSAANQVVQAVITSSTQATGDGDFATNAVATDTITVGTQVYTFVSALDNSVSNQVLIAGTAALTMANFVDAINATATAGTRFSSPTTANIDVTATPGAGSLMSVTARAIGDAGNGIALTTTSSHFSWGAATTAGGVTGATIALAVSVGGSKSSSATDFFYTPGSPDISTSTPVSDGAILVVTYVSPTGNMITLRNSAAAALGIVPAYDIMSAQDLTQVAAAIQQGNAVLGGFSVIPSEFTFITDSAGLFVGGFLTIALTVPTRLATKVNGQWLIQDIQAQWMTGFELLDEPYGHFRYTVKVINTTQYNNYQNTLQRLLASPKTSSTALAPQQGLPEALAERVLFSVCLELSNVTVHNDISPHINIVMPPITMSPPTYQVGIGERVVAVLRKAITADLTVRFNKLTLSSPPSTVQWTVTIPNGTPVNENVYDFGNKNMEFREGDILWADVIASDGQATDANGIASFTVVWG